MIRTEAYLLVFLPRRLGILTSGGGTVINDFRASLEKAEFGFELFWRSVRVQGVDACEDILAGLSELLKLKRIDAILIFRGGGSKAELAVFNNYDIARAICLSPVPVISAIGHQEDQSSAQDVSFRALGVPKDVGRFFADAVVGYRDNISHWSALIKNAGVSIYRYNSQTLSLVARGIKDAVFSRCHNTEERLLSSGSQLPILARRLIEQRVSELGLLAKPLLALGKEVPARSFSAFSSLAFQIEERIKEKLLRSELTA